MKKLDLSAVSTTIGMPEKSGSLLHIQSAISETAVEIIKGLIGDNYNPLLPYRIEGLINTGGTVSAGSIFFNNEYFKVDSFSLPSPANAQIVTTYFTAVEADPVEFTDGIPRSVHEIRKINFINTTPAVPLGFVFGDLKDLNYIPYTVTNATPSPTIKFDKNGRLFRSFVTTGETALTITLDGTGAKDGAEVYFLMQSDGATITFTNTTTGGFTGTVMGLGGSAATVAITVGSTLFFVFKFKAYVSTIVSKVSLEVLENT